VDGISTHGDRNYYLNNYIHDLMEAGLAHPDFFQYGTNASGLTNNIIEGHYCIGGGVNDEHVTQWSNANSGGGTATENILRGNVFHNVGSYSLGINNCAYGFTDTRYYNNTMAEAREYSGQSAVTRSISLYGGVQDTHIYNILEHEGWGDDVTSGIDYIYSSGSISHDYNFASDPQGDVEYTSRF